MEFLEVPLFDDDIFKLCVRLGFDLLFPGLVTLFAIFRHDRKRAFLFAAIMMNVMVFFICFTLKKIDLGLGMALGLFAIFGVLMYRTSAISPRADAYGT